MTSKIEITKDAPRPLPPYIILWARDPDAASVQIGNQNETSYLTLFAKGKSSFQVSALENGCSLRIGGLIAAEGMPATPTNGTITINGTNGFNRFKFSGDDGAILLNNKDNKRTLEIDGQGGNIWLGGNGTDGDLVIFPSKATNINNLNQATLHFDGQEGKLWLGGNGKDGEIVIFPTTATNNHDNNQATLLMDGQTGNISTKGDITLENADCAEEFDVPLALSDVEPGTVMVIDKDGILQRSKRAYDKRVAGVVSGAGDYKPGIILGKKMSSSPRVPVALVGKVNCKVDADYSQIEVGDMLTTSNTPGHAMKALSRSRSFGAVVGKALHAIKSGRDLIPILIALQ